MKKILLIISSIVLLASLILILVEFVLPALQPSVGRLSINTQGIEAQVYLDSKHIGKTPFYQDDLRIGEHTVELQPSKNSNFRWKTNTFLNSSTLSVLDLDLATNQTFSAGENLYFKPGLSGITVLTKPEGANLKIDGRTIGKTPQNLSLSPGIHLILVEKSGYLSREIPINIETGYKLSALVYLAVNPFETVIKIDSSPKASLFRISNRTIDLSKSYPDWVEGIKHIQNNLAETATKFDVLISADGKVHVINSTEWNNKKAAKSTVNIGYLSKNQTDKISEVGSKEWQKIKADFN